MFSRSKLEEPPLAVQLFPPVPTIQHGILMSLPYLTPPAREGRERERERVEGSVRCCRVLHCALASSQGFEFQ